MSKEHKKSNKAVVEPDQILEQGLTPEEAELAATEEIEEENDIISDVSDEKKDTEQ